MAGEVVVSTGVLVKDPLIKTYKEKYGFNYIEDSKFKIRENIDSLTSLVKSERYNARRKIFEYKLKAQEVLYHDYELCETLQADLIDLPIVFKPSLNIGGRDYTNLWIVRNASLYLGGIENILYYTKLLGAPDTYNKGYSYSSDYVTINRSVYIGDLPDNIQRKYELAKRYIDKDRICVVSKDPSLFSSTQVVIPPKLSPLLVAQTETGKLLLLAVWGLEHELPKSLGGLLDN